MFSCPRRSGESDMVGESPRISRLSGTTARNHNVSLVVSVYVCVCWSVGWLVC